MKDEDLQSKMIQLTLRYVSLKILQYSVGDKALLQFTEFISKEKVTNNDKFSTFNRKTQRPDDLCFDDIRVQEKYPELSTFMQIVFVLSHGQASVDCGFNDNNLVLKLNQNDDTVVARRFIKNHLKADQVQPHTLFIDQKMFRLLKSNWRLYNIRLKNIRENEKKDETKEQLTCLDNQLSGLRVQSESIEKTIFSLDQMFEEMVKKGEILNENLLITEGVVLKDKNKEKAEELKILKRKIQELEEEKAKKMKL